MTSRTNNQSEQDTQVPCIQIRGARQNNLKNLDLDIRLGEFTVIAGVSGSGKSSLVFDTLYAEGQRRYVETFSPYARQYLDRLNPPDVDNIDGIPPAIGFDDSNTIRTSRSTVGTMTEINDHIKLLFAKYSRLFCPSCAREVIEHTPQSIWNDIQLRLHKQQMPSARVYITFDIEVPAALPIDAAKDGLSAQGFTRFIGEKVDPQTGNTVLTVCVDRFKSDTVEEHRAIQAIELGLEKGRKTVDVYIQIGDDYQKLATYRAGLTCGDCNKTFEQTTDKHFSFNSPVGLCPECKGFGKLLEADPDKVIPDKTLSIDEDMIKLWAGKKRDEYHGYMHMIMNERNLNANIYTPYNEYTDEEIAWLWNGDAALKTKKKYAHEWPGIYGHFKYMEQKSYKKSVRMQLTKYRSEVTCSECEGAHLKPQMLLWRYGQAPVQRKVTDKGKQGYFKPRAIEFDNKTYEQLPGLNFHELMLLPISDLHEFFKTCQAHDEAEGLILSEICTRLNYLCEVGLNYLTLDRQGRTLSSGEVKRVNLASSLGVSLVNTLFVLDEPSVGLHPRDTDRVNKVMRDLTDAGNTLVVIEHDPQVMLAGQRIIELGPKAGDNGGTVTFNGTTREILKSNCLTGQYLSGQQRIKRDKWEINPNRGIEITNADFNNLKNVNVTFPAQSLTVVCGVSGSGKSSLVGDVLVSKLNDPLFKAEMTKKLGKFEFEYMDQSSVAKNIRSTAISYLESYTHIRNLMSIIASSEDSHQFKPEDFSFLTGKYRCPTCKGTGLEVIEMQFLSDVQMPCPTCQGKRFTSDVLGAYVQLKDKKFNIADILELSFEQAAFYFDQHPNFGNTFKYMNDLGLGYIKLGQSTTTMSSGELQRLKVARLLLQMDKNRSKPYVLIFDEPTRGLHFEDIKALMSVFDKLVRLGHTIVLIEHHLDVINNADWVIEMGPESGDDGGEVVFTGTPDQLAKKASTHTGKSLQAWRETLQQVTGHESFFNLPALQTVPYDLNRNNIVVTKANEHNLKNLSVKVPREKFTVITGPSGSGKSTLAFNLIFAEGQRRYLESLNAYARSRVNPPPIPDVESIRGIPPTVSISQHTSRGGMRSTVATMSELWHYIRLIYEKLGTQYCPCCDIPIEGISQQAIAEKILSEYQPGQCLYFMSQLAYQKKGGFYDVVRVPGNYLIVDGQYINTTLRTLDLNIKQDHTIYQYIEKFVVGKDSPKKLQDLINLSLSNPHHAFVISTDPAFENILSTQSAVEPVKESDLKHFTTMNACAQCGRTFAAITTKSFSYNSIAGACPTCSGYGVISAALASKQNDEMVDIFSQELSEEALKGRNGEVLECPSCHGSRLNDASRAVKWKGISITELGKMTIDECLTYFTKLDLSQREVAIIGRIVDEIKMRLSFLKKVDLDYMQLDRSAPTLSGGEAQRIRLAAQLGSNLKGVCYILDEPTIGLHARDNGMLLNAIEGLTHKGNTLIVVEHDEETIRRAEHIIDIGPGAGIRGGQLVAQGTIEDIQACEASSTGHFLQHPVQRTGKPERKINLKTDTKITFKDLKRHNVNIKSLDIPLNSLTVITGVSGSGKSTLAHDIIYENLVRAAALKKGEELNTIHCSAFEGIKLFDRVLQVDQTPIGKNSRSCPATYTDIMGAIRNLFASTTEAQIRGYTIKHFTFNGEGACPECNGLGFKTVEMSFMPDVQIPCEVCNGGRYRHDIEQVTWKGKNIAQVLKMEVDEAVQFFDSVPSLAKTLKLLQDVGLGYLTLGQTSTTLSGGEAQRIKLVTELSKVRNLDKFDHPVDKTKNIYILDEPTVGLHMADVNRLINVLKRLVKVGNTIILIEHNLDMISEADWVIDMGPEGGIRGGQVVGQGQPYEIAKLDTPTGKVLKEFLTEHK